MNKERSFIEVFSVLKGCKSLFGTKGVILLWFICIFFAIQVIRLSVINSFTRWDCDFISILQEAIIGGLQSETTYSVTVAAYTTKGDGARSKAKVITTTGAGQRQFSQGYPEENIVHSMSICLLGIRVSSLWLWTDASIFLFLKELWGESSLFC